MNTGRIIFLVLFYGILFVCHGPVLWILLTLNVITFIMGLFLLALPVLIAYME